MAAPHNGVNPAFYSCNRGKKSLAIDLKSEEGKEILLKLVKEADVFMQNFRPGAIERMGFGEDVLREVNKKLINVSIFVLLVVFIFIYLDLTNKSCLQWEVELDILVGMRI